MQRAEEGVSLSELMIDLDNSLVYGGARRISEYEAELLDQMDDIFDEQIRMAEELEQSKNALKSTKETIRKTDMSISEYCSEMTRNKILLAKGWQFAPKKKGEILSALSDKELLEEAERQANNHSDDKEKVTMQAVVGSIISNGIGTQDVENVDRAQHTEKELEVEGETKDD